MLRAVAINPKALARIALSSIHKYQTTADYKFYPKVLILFNFNLKSLLIAQISAKYITHQAFPYTRRCARINKIANV
jgi:hypothetical protein